MNSTQTKNPTSPFNIGDYLRYNNKGKNDIVDLADINTNDNDSTQCRIKFLRRKKMIVTKEFIK